MPEIEGSEKRQGLHLACFRSTAVESKENSPARTPKRAAKCESQVSIEEIFCALAFCAGIREIVDLYRQGVKGSLKRCGHEAARIL